MNIVTIFSAMELAAKRMEIAVDARPRRSLGIMQEGDDWAVEYQKRDRQHQKFRTRVLEYLHSASTTEPISRKYVIECKEDGLDWEPWDNTKIDDLMIARVLTNKLAETFQSPFRIVRETRISILQTGE